MNRSRGLIEKTLERRKKYLGRRYDDFEIVSIDFNWEFRRYENRAKCVHCGREKMISDLPEFLRGKGASGRCECQRQPKQKPVVKPVRQKSSDHVGEVIGDFKLIGYHGEKGFRIECQVCGNTRWESVTKTLTGECKCNHRPLVEATPNDYSDPKYIGMRVGYLTSVKRLGRTFLFRCDCGNEVVHRPTDVFKKHGPKSCGKPGCEYHKRLMVGGNETRLAGVAFEFECASEMEKQGFEVEMTPTSGDYGVDFLATVDGEQVAFQCKKMRKESMVRAVQEVYAGGHYYGCSQFVVISPSGFTRNAEAMASKLGVQLEQSVLNFHLTGERRVKSWTKSS